MNQIHVADIESKPLRQQVRKMMSDNEARFRSVLTEPINAAVGNQRWAIVFMLDNTDRHPVFLADVYAPDHATYLTIVSVVTDNMKDLKFCCFYKGTVSNQAKISGWSNQ